MRLEPWEITLNVNVNCLPLMPALAAMEQRIVGAIMATAAELQQKLDDQDVKLDELGTAMTTEIQQVLDAMTNANTAQAAVDAAVPRLQGMQDKVTAMIDALKADDPTV